MTGWSRAPLRRPPAARWLVPILAVLFAAVAVGFAPGLWWENAVLLVPVCLFIAWVRWPVLMPVLGTLTPATVILVCIGNWLEPSLFLVSLLALVATAWEDRRWLAWTIAALCVLTPVLAAALAPAADIMWPVWVLGIGFPTVIGLVIRRLEQVSAELARARRELADRAVIDERQRIGREVHDLVGHGLAAVLLHVTGARHVLRRDPDAADEALRTAEDVGRQSIRELRRTVDLLRDSPAEDAPPTTLHRIRHLVALYEAAGLRLEFSAEGDLDAATPPQALAAYRIAQQAIANAAQHSRQRSTRVRLHVLDDLVTLNVDSVGNPVTDIGSGHGLASMRERARVAGGLVRSGPTVRGWEVHCELPVRGVAQ